MPVPSAVPVNAAVAATPVSAAKALVVAAATPASVKPISVEAASVQASSLFDALPVRRSAADEPPVVPGGPSDKPPENLGPAKRTPPERRETMSRRLLGAARRSDSRWKRLVAFVARVTGVYALWSVYRDGVLVQRYAERLADPKETITQRASSARLLASLGRVEAVPSLGYALENDPSPTVQRAALSGLLHLADLRAPRLIRELRFSPLTSSREAAAENLAWILRHAESPLAVEALASAAMADIKEDVRLAAIRALSTARSPKAILSLIWMKRQEKRPHMRSALAMALSEAQNRAAARGRVSYRPPEDEFSDTKQPLYAAALKRVLAVGAVFATIEFVGGMMTGSVALKADAAHLLADLAVTAGALFSVWMARRPPTSRRTYGYLKMESLIGLGSAVAIAAMSLGMLREAYERFYEPAVMTGGWGVILLACAGLAANALSTLMLYRYRDENLGLKGAFLHAAMDAIGSVGIILASIARLAFGWTLADPIVSVLIVALVLHTTWGLGKASWHVLIDGVPPGTDLDAIETDMLAIPGVVGVHDLHAWSLNSTETIMTATVFVKPGTDLGPVLAAAKAVAREKHGFGHATIQVEPLPE